MRHAVFAACCGSVARCRFGWNVGRVEDLFGHHWEIAKELVPS